MKNILSILFVLCSVTMSAQNVAVSLRSSKDVSIRSMYTASSASMQPYGTVTSSVWQHNSPSAVIRTYNSPPLYHLLGVRIRWGYARRKVLLLRGMVTNLRNVECLLSGRKPMVMEPIGILKKKNGCPSQEEKEEIILVTPKMRMDNGGYGMVQNGSCLPLSHLFQ